MAATHLAEKRFGRLVLIGLAFLLAVIYEIFAFKHWHGIGALAFVLLTTILFLLTAKYYQLVKNKWALWFLFFPVVLGVDLALYNHELINVFAPLFILLSYLLFIFVLTVKQPEGKTDFRFRKIPIPNLFRAIWKAIQDLTESPSQEKQRVVVKVLVGIIIAVPLVLIFGSLFADADRNFADFINNIFNFDINEVLLFRILRLAFITLFMASVFYAVIDSRFVLKSHERKVWKLDSTIVVTVMVILNSLFLTFVVIQFKDLFVSYQYILDNDIVFARFARSGFFQLLWASGLALALFLAIFRSFAEHGMGWWIKSLLILFLAQTGVVAYSALHSMNLYQEAYGFTVDRFYAEIIIYFIIISLGLGIAWILANGKFAKLFYAGGTLAIVAFLIGVSMNVDAIIARKNLNRALDEGKPLDANYLRFLSVDIAPVVYEAIDSGKVSKLSYPNQEALFRILDTFQKNNRSNAYLNFNLGRYRAKQAAKESGSNSTAFYNQKLRLDRFKQDLNYVHKNSVNTYWGTLNNARGLISYQILPKFYTKPWKDNENFWSWPPHVTFLRSKPVEQVRAGMPNFEYVNDVVLFTDAEYVKIRKEYGGIYPYIFLLQDGTIWKLNPDNLTKEVYRVRFNGTKFELYK
ncbi:MAG TPA: DUF4173 domain-containing protein [Patescibacteria group bacterium]|nr:DUF4173 domain-containing protein [Patescibacteria group bacterium]